MRRVRIYCITQYLKGIAQFTHNDFTNSRKRNVLLNGSDVFWERYQNQHTIYQNVNSEKGHNDSRRVKLSVSWKFGSSQYQRDEKKKGAEEELKRAGGN